MNMTIDQARAKIDNIQTQLDQARDDYSQRTSRIKADENLSDAGKKNELAKLKTEYRVNIDGLVIDMRRAVLEEATEAQSVQGLKELIERDYSKWDYNRLAYEANRVRSAFVLAGGDDFGNIMQAWQQAKARGDKHEIKAWMDTAPAILPQAGTIDSYGIQTRAKILQDIANTEIFTLTDEGRKFETERAARVQNLQQLAGLADVIGGEIATMEGAPRAYVMQRVFDGVTAEKESGKIIVDKQPGETAAQLYERTEADYQERVKQIETFAGQTIDTLVYGVE